jgi:hypothetical protein
MEMEKSHKKEEEKRGEAEVDEEEEGHKWLNYD